MKKQLLIIPFILILSGFSRIQAQDEWTFKTEKDGIKVYTGNASDGKFKPVKVECIFNATASQLVAVLLDIKNYAQWAYHTRSATLLKQPVPNELFYYGEISVPWPMHNRDFVAHITVTQDPSTKVVTVEAPAAPGIVPEKEGLVRIHSKGKWIITPVDGKGINVVYFLQLDPGGGAPALLVNMFSAEGPLNSFKNLKQQIQKPAYKNAVLPFIKN